VIEEEEMAVGSDEEKTAVNQEKGADISNDETEEDKKKREVALKEQPKMTNTFSWQNLNYVIPAGRGKTRKLLDNVSGFVSPGKLTALMGESGAGKVHLSVLKMWATY
jgi:ATP-binding cassette subfamily G (WHITE) protein 2 (SNQ2)